MVGDGVRIGVLVFCFNYIGDSTMPTVDSVIREVATVQLLKWAAGYAIFCPECQRILDWQSTNIVNDCTVCDRCFLLQVNACLAKHPEIDAARWFDGLDIQTASNWYIDTDARTLQRGARLLKDECATTCTHCNQRARCSAAIADGSCPDLR